MITLPNSSPSDEDYKLAARELWKVYTTGEVKTKKILHFVFNERNAYMISDCELRAYGLLDIYKKYGSLVILRAKNYLSALAVDQIDERSIENYLKGRRLRKS